MFHIIRKIYIKVRFIFFSTSHIFIIIYYYGLYFDLIDYFEF